MHNVRRGFLIAGVLIVTCFFSHPVHAQYTANFQTNIINNVTSNWMGSNVDMDGDGFTNAQEFQAGTDPQDSASAFRIIAIAAEGDDLRVTWMMGSGKTNALQSSAGDGGLYNNDFADVFTVTNTVGSSTNYLDSGAGTNLPGRFYRVRLVP